MLERRPSGVPPSWQGTPSVDSSAWLDADPSGLAEHVTCLFSDAEEGVKGEKDDDALLASFFTFACRHGFRTDPRTTFTTPAAIDDCMLLVRKHLKLVSRSQRYVTTILHRFIIAVKTVQKAFRRYVVFKEAQALTLLSRWKLAENTARCRIRKEVMIREFDMESGLIGRLVGGQKTQVLKSLCNDCWTSDSLKRASVGQLWAKARASFKQRFRTWKAEYSEAKTAEPPDGTVDFTALFEPKKENKGRARVTARVGQFGRFVTMPRFTEGFNVRTITVAELVREMGLYLNAERMPQPPPGTTAAAAAAAVEASPTGAQRGAACSHNLWVRYYTGLLRFRPRHVNALLTLSFKLSGKQALLAAEAAAPEAGDGAAAAAAPLSRQGSRGGRGGSRTGPAAVGRPPTPVVGVAEEEEGQQEEAATATAEAAAATTPAVAAVPVIRANPPPPCALGARAREEAMLKKSAELGRGASRMPAPQTQQLLACRYVLKQTQREADRERRRAARSVGVDAAVACRNSRRSVTPHPSEIHARRCHHRPMTPVVLPPPPQAKVPRPFVDASLRAVFSPHPPAVTYNGRPSSAPPDPRRFPRGNPGLSMTCRQVTKSELVF